MKRLAFICLTLLLCWQTGYALDLQTAKTQGLVGETTTGYLAPVDPGHVEAAKLAATINAQRKTQYEEIARRNNTPLQAVEQLAAKKAIEKTPPGQFIRVNGTWRRK
ncbi:YdbL family protein [Desulfobulbus alkaliphilus]|uniref:YdbL family protein n=1 Tax=Desulfobulbus alkaliphilus TaxID=869814 RepID=UPI0019637545|nr:YdbL family protein [Desulfobulbus alkaliphilus]MBM9538253.1 YdbL family protein [Desulfobulbus alkaliphilus]